MKEPFVTIAIPTYKRIKTLEESVASALSQTYPHIEILIGHNPSEESFNKLIQDWCEDIAQEIPQVRYKKNLRNLGMAGNWNALADAAKGEYLIFLADDDRLLPNCIETLVNALKTDTRVVFSNHFLIDSLGNRLVEESYQFTKEYYRDKFADGEVMNPEICAWQNSIPISAALIETKSVQRLRFQEDLNTPEIEFFIRLAQEDGNFIFLNQYLSEYRIHEQSSTSLMGLYVNKLVSYLLKIPVSPEVEPYKQKLLSKLMINAVSLCLLEGQWKQAREFLKSDYYPYNERGSFKGLTQVICSQLPPFAGHRIYKLFHTIKHTL